MKPRVRVRFGFFATIWRDLASDESPAREGREALGKCSAIDVTPHNRISIIAALSDGKIALRFGPMDLTERAPRPIRFHLAECKRFARVYLILYARARAEPESRPLSKRVSIQVKYARVSTRAGCGWESSDSL